MKKFIALLLAMLMALSLAACGKQEAAAPAADDGASEPEVVDYSAMSQDELKASLTTVDAGKLTVATSPDFAPYEFYVVGDDGEPTLAGFDMDLAKLIAQKLGLELEVIPMDFDGSISELGAG